MLRNMARLSKLLPLITHSLWIGAVIAAMKHNIIIITYHWIKGDKNQLYKNIIIFGVILIDNNGNKIICKNNSNDNLFAK